MPEMNKEQLKEEIDRLNEENDALKEQIQGLQETIDENDIKWKEELSKTLEKAQYLMMEREAISRFIADVLKKMKTE